MTQEPPPHGTPTTAAADESVAAAAETRVAIYTRTATSSARAELHRQTTQCRAEARRRGFVIVAELHDTGVPGSLAATRPGWDRVVELIEHRAIELVLCTDFTRITRQWGDMPALLTLARSYHVDFLSVDPHPTSLRTDRFLP